MGDGMYGSLRYPDHHRSVKALARTPVATAFSEILWSMTEHSGY